MDLSWNYATESQAYDRVHRLGQEKEVFVKRLVVRDTIEERYVSICFFRAMPYPYGCVAHCSPIDLFCVGC